MRVGPQWTDVPSRGLLASYFRSLAMGDQVATATSVCVPRAVFEAVGEFYCRSAWSRSGACGLGSAWRIRSRRFEASRLPSISEMRKGV